MPTPAVQSCTFAGCTYMTPEGIPNWDLLTTHLKLHMTHCHADTTGGNSTAPSKTAKKERPSITNQMSEESWRFFLDEWSRYKRQTGIKGQELLDELWGCQVEELRQLGFAEGGAASLITEDAMVKKIKSLAVISLHSSVHVVNLHELRQQSDENVHAFAARVRGIAASCVLQKKCHGCQEVVTYSEETCYHVVMAGLCDQSMKEKALTQAMMETITDLNSLVKWCTAEESGRLGIPGHQVAGVRQSHYKQQQKTKQLCHHCGLKRHGDGSATVREKECKAFGKVCSKCSKKNHFAATCKATSPGNTNAITSEAPNDNVNALHFLAMHLSSPTLDPALTPFPALATAVKHSPALAPAAKHSPALAPAEKHSPALAPAVNHSPALAPAVNPFPASVPAVNISPTLASADKPFPALASADISSPTASSPISDFVDTRIFTPKKQDKETLLMHRGKKQHRKQLTAPAGTPNTPILPYPLPQHIPTTPAHLASLVQDMHSWGSKTVNTVPLPHMLHDIHEGWYKSRPSRNPDLSLTIQLHLPSYRELGLTAPTFRRKLNNPTRATRTPSNMDTGAQMTVCPVSTLTELGIQHDTILPLQSRIEGASSEPIALLGGIMVEVTGRTPDGRRELSCLQMMYVSRAVKRVYMSKDACIQLQVVPDNFPVVGSCSPDTDSRPYSHVSAVTSSLTKCTNTGLIQPGTEECKCPARSLPPQDPPTLPCKPTPENLPILKDYILNRYAASAFNVCQKQPLPLMKGSPPLRLHVDPSARPVAVHTPAQIPLHWQDAVKGGLDRDVRLGVLEKVPVNEPVEWCSRMVVQPKPSGEPRRTIDYQPLNSHAPRQTHHTETPWSLVSSIPPDQVKSVLDCWHGYHSVSLEESDRPLTTFITPYGRYRYKTCPQGFISAGDAFTHRMQEIIKDFPRLKKCIDDNLIYDKDIATNFFRVCEFLSTCSSQGCVFNPGKFQFGEQSVKFLGFQVTSDSIRPTDDFLQNIMSFPTPQNITDVRSWYGAVAQISYAFATAPAMQPFKHLLSTKAPFQWSPDLDHAFETSKLEIVRQCVAGVRSFNHSLQTALATDWSKLAMGYWLCQKHCACESTKPGCCKEGWQTVHVGSRFCTPAESRYAPIEGEAVTSTWAMDKCKFFLLGLPNFTLALDHKPLISLLGKQEFLTIPNPRLMSCKLKSVLYTFTPAYIPGKLHVVPDCLSRRSDSPVPSPPPPKPVLDISNVSPQYQDTCSPPSWVSQPLQNSDSCVLAPMSIQPTTEDNAISDQLDLPLIGAIMSALAALDLDPLQDVPLLAPVRQQPVVLSYSRLEAAAATCPLYTSLRSLLTSGPPEEKQSWPQQLHPYYQHRHALFVVGNVVLLHDRPVIPVAVRREVLEHLHGAHGSVSTMYARAVTCMYWPNIRDDIMMSRAACSSCNLNAPSNPAPPPHPVTQPSFPFSDICADFFDYSSRSYLVVVDR